MAALAAALMVVGLLVALVGVALGQAVWAIRKEVVVLMVALEVGLTRSLQGRRLAAAAAVGLGVAQTERGQEAEASKVRVVVSHAFV